MYTLVSIYWLLVWSLQFSSPNIHFVWPSGHAKAYQLSPTKPKSLSFGHLFWIQAKYFNLAKILQQNFMQGSKIKVIVQAVNMQENIKWKQEVIGPSLTPLEMREQMRGVYRNTRIQDTVTIERSLWIRYSSQKILYSTCFWIIQCAFYIQFYCNR